MTKKILISGGTGFVGQEIVKKLLSQDCKVYVLTRSPKKIEDLFNSENAIAIKWDSYNDDFDTSDLKDLDSVINLVGESLTSKRWSDNQKKEIYNSRIVATETIIKVLHKSNIQIDSFISTSAIGIYSEGFLKNVCQKWEEAANKASIISKRICILRVSVVLGANGGMISELVTIFKLGLGGRLGSGKQMMSWIHIDDLSSMYLECLNNHDLNSAMNASSRFNITNAKFTQVFAKLLNSKARFSVPKVMLFLAKGEVAGMILESQDVKPEKFNSIKFKYSYPTIDLALKNIVSNL
jgi:uncharacterized protein (TIGR01777 family)